MNLLVLAPGLQEEILFLPASQSGRDAITLHHLQPIARVPFWTKQRRLWHQLKRQLVRERASPGQRQPHTRLRRKPKNFVSPNDHPGQDFENSPRKLTAATPEISRGFLQKTYSLTTGARISCPTRGPRPHGTNTYDGKLEHCRNRTRFSHRIHRSFRHKRQRLPNSNGLKAEPCTYSAIFAWTAKPLHIGTQKEQDKGQKTGGKKDAPTPLLPKIVQAWKNAGILSGTGTLCQRRCFKYGCIRDSVPGHSA